MNSKLARFAIVCLLELRRGGLKILLSAFGDGNSESSELRFQYFKAEKWVSRSVDIVGQCGDGLSGDYFGSGIASLDR